MCFNQAGIMTSSEKVQNTYATYANSIGKSTGSTGQSDFSRNMLFPMWLKHLCDLCDLCDLCRSLRASGRAAISNEPSTRGLQNDATLLQHAAADFRLLLSVGKSLYRSSPSGPKLLAFMKHRSDASSLCVSL